MNSVLTIHARPQYSEIDPVWVFSDDRVGLVDEPFVGNVNTCLTKLVRSKQLPLPPGVIVTFSGGKLPQVDIELERVTPSARNQGLGHYYNWLGMVCGLNCWLCPALFKYFDAAPKRIYATVRGI